MVGLAVFITIAGFSIFIYGLVSFAIREKKSAEMSAFFGLVVVCMGFLLGGLNLRHPEFVHQDLPQAVHAVHHLTH